jgi:hypothetical protein
MESADGRSQILWKGSTGDPDRDGEVVPLEGWHLKNYGQHNQVYWNHHTRGSNDFPIGKAPKVFPDEKEGLIFQIEFMKDGDAHAAQVEKSQGIYRMSLAGFITGGSVGFVPLEEPTLKTRKNAKPLLIWGDRELVEFSLVNICANPNAVRLGLDSGVLKKDYDPPMIQEMVQAATRYGKNIEWGEAVDEIIQPYIKEIEDTRAEEKAKESPPPVVFDMGRIEKVLDRLDGLDGVLQAAQESVTTFAKRVSALENRIEEFGMPSQYGDPADGQNGGKDESKVLERAIKAIQSGVRHG